MLQRKLILKEIGLGLSISKGIVNQFGGDIFVKSKWKEGSSFSFYIALSKKENENVIL